MSPFRIGLLLVAAGLGTGTASAQTLQPPQCLHGGRESQTQAQRRIDALDASDLIIRALDRLPRADRYPTWEALAMSSRIASLRGMAGRDGELARRIQWGADEPLPGWRVHYVATPDGYAFSLTDSRDPCEFTFSSNDTGMVIEGRPADRRGQVRVIPLDSTR